MEHCSINTQRLHRTSSTSSTCLFFQAHADHDYWSPARANKPETLRAYRFQRGTMRRRWVGTAPCRCREEQTNKQTIQYNTIQYNTIQYNTIQYNTIQYNTIQYNTIQYNTIQYNTIQYNTIQYNTIQYNTRQDKTRQTNKQTIHAPFLNPTAQKPCRRTLAVTLISPGSVCQEVQGKATGDCHIMAQVPLESDTESLSSVRHNVPR